MKKMAFDVTGDDQLSARLQRVLFDIGYKWGYSSTDVLLSEEMDVIYCNDDGLLEHSSKSYYELEDNEEYPLQNIDWMRQETYVFGPDGRKYKKSDFDKALAAIKPVED